MTFHWRIVYCYLIIAVVYRITCQDMYVRNLDDDDDDDNNNIAIVQVITLPQTPVRVLNQASRGLVLPSRPSQPEYVQRSGSYNASAKSAGSSLSGVCQRKLTMGGWGYFPFPGSCNQFLHCDQEQRGFLETCAVGTFFNGQKCVRAEDVACRWDPCRRLPNGRLYSDGQTCYGFYKCANGQSVSGVCPAMTAFNALKQNCIPDNTCVQSTGVNDPCSIGTTFPVPGKPNMFYLWDGGDGVTPMQCPRGLWYNPRVCTCDWIVAGETKATRCQPMFHFGFNGNFLEKYNQAPLSPNTAVSIFQKSAFFTKGGRIVIWMMNDIDMDSEWAMCFEFMTEVEHGEVALIANDWKRNQFTYKITYLPKKALVKGYFRMKDGAVVELLIMGVTPNKPHFLRVAKLSSIMKLRVDNMPAATVEISSGVASARSPMIVGAARNCEGFVGYFDELKFFRCLPGGFFDDYTRY